MVSIILVILISIHAPARGATSINPFFSSSTINFNPRSREGSDIIFFRSDPARIDISIHAPARGATPNPNNQTSDGKFQSTLPRGERQISNPFARQLSEISIHAPARGATTTKCSMRNISFLISIHAPARGATKNYLVTVNRFYISIHAPARGATPSNYHQNPHKKFQSTLPRGERQQSAKGYYRGWKFQSTLPRGERLMRF